MCFVFCGLCLYDCSRIVTTKLLTIISNEHKNIVANHTHKKEREKNRDDGGKTRERERERSIHGRRKKGDIPTRYIISNPFIWSHLA